MPLGLRGGGDHKFFGRWRIFGVVPLSLRGGGDYIVPVDQPSKGVVPLSLRGGGNNKSVVSVSNAAQRPRN